jgi:phosphoglycolate phosphatase-like HAD superfamily hydrolase
MIGDSATDVIAGQLANVPVIGYAGRPGKATALADASVTINSLDSVTAVLRGQPWPQEPPVTPG